MKIKYRISFRNSKLPNLLEILHHHTIKYKANTLPGDSSPLISFDIYNNHPAWVEIKALVDKHKISYLTKNIFSRKEIQEAKWCRLKPYHYIDYPQPEDEWQSTHFTYENYDPKSGVFSDQSKPFRIKDEPKSNKIRDFMTLYWTYVLLAKNEVIDVLKNKGVSNFDTFDVLLNTSGMPSRKLSQIIIPTITSATAKLSKHSSPREYEYASKYLPHTVGVLEYSEKLLLETEDFLLSKEWFGDGSMAYREILVSQKVSNLVLENRWRGIDLEPIKIV